MAYFHDLIIVSSILESCIFSDSGLHFSERCYMVFQKVIFTQTYDVFISAVVRKNVLYVQNLCTMARIRGNSALNQTNMM